MENKIKNQAGLTGIDITIAVSIIIILVPIVMLVFVNIYTNTESAKRNSEATSYATQIIQETQKMYYTEVTEENVEKIVEQMNIPVGYEVDVAIIPYQENDNTIEDLVKTIEVTISYKVGKEMEMVKLSKIKAKENLIIPNKPELGEQYVPVKYKEDGTWRIISENDTTWYNYTNKNWAIVMSIEGLEVEDGIEVTTDNKEQLIGEVITKVTDMYVWIPRYSTQNGEVEFLYQTTNRTVDENGEIGQTDLSTTFESGQKGVFLLINDTSNPLYQTLNESKYGPRK